jgi:hypothetical protein
MDLFMAQSAAVADRRYGYGAFGGKSAGSACPSTTYARKWRFSNQT